MYAAKGTQAYAQIGVESAVMSASQQQLVTMLFDGVLSALVRARLFMQDNNQQGKGVSLSKAINIIENGLRVSLDEESKDELTQNLIALYSYMVRRLLQANLRNDVSAVEEVEALMRNIADAWKESLLFFDSGPSLMNNAPHLYFAWQQLVEKSQLMLRLATEEQWDELIASEMAYVNAVQEIAHLTEEVAPSTTMQEQLRPMLRLILDNESKIKQLLQIRMDELAKLVGQSSVQKSVLSAYGDQGGFVLAPQDNLF